MTIIYNIQSYDNSIRLFGNNFVKNNINNCYLLIDGQKIKLCEKLILKKEQKNKNILEIKLIETNKITNMSYMFYDCSKLNNLPDISKWNTKNVTDMKYMFRGCSSLNNLPDISKWNTKKLADMKFMFYGCNNIIIPKKFLNK